MIPELVSVSGGTFLMGSDSGNDDEKPPHEVIVDPFFIGKYSVTVKAFDYFLRNSGYSYPGIAFEKPLHPVTNVSWFDADEYCRWLSGLTQHVYRLPAEAEWEFAATCGRAENIYPWGSRTWEEWPELHTRFVHEPEPVGSFAPNSFGIHDMGMNVHEWCLDWYDPNFYRDSPVLNPRGPEAGKRRSSRGGSWRHQIKITRCAARSSIPPEYRYADYGFRIVRAIK